MTSVYFGSYLLLSLNFRDISDFSSPPPPHPPSPRDMLKETYVRINNISCFRNRGILETGWELRLILSCFILISSHESKVMKSPWFVCVCVCTCTVRSESRCALRLRYVDLVASIEVAAEVCCCFTVFSC
jgi:hypothetical protein